MTVEEAKAKIFQDRRAGWLREAKPRTAIAFVWVLRETVHGQKTDSEN